MCHENCHHLQISELEGGGGLLQYEGGLLEVEGGLLLALGGHHLGPRLPGGLGLGGHSALQLHRNSHILKTGSMDLVAVKEKVEIMRIEREEFVNNFSM